MGYLNNDKLERYRFRYKSEGELHGISLEQFCARRNSFEHFGSDSGVEMAPCYHSIISTLQARGASVWHGLGKLFTKVIDRVEDFLSIFSPHPDIIPS